MDPPRPPLGGGVRGVDIVDPFLKDDDFNDEDVFDIAPLPLPPPRARPPTFRTRACRAAVEAAVVEDDAEAAAEAAVLDDVAAAFAALRAIAADSGDDDDEDVVSSSSGDDEAFFATAKASSFGILCHRIVLLDF
jgi:hypothetical protein